MSTEIKSNEPGGVRVAGLQSTPGGVAVNGVVRVPRADFLAAVETECGVRIVPAADLPEIVGTTTSGDAEWYVFADGRVRGILVQDEHYDRAVAYLAAHEYLAAHPPVPPVSDEDVETLAGLLDDAPYFSADQIARRLLATGHVSVTR